MRTLWIIGFVLFFASCKTSSVSTNTTSYANYQEDLNSSLPVYPDYGSQVNQNAESNANVSVQSVDAQLEEVEKSVISKNKSAPYFNGFTVLIYSGVDRDKAFRAQRDLTQLYPDLEAEMQYNQPRYLVKVGRFAHKIEAQKSFAQLKANFPTARIIQDRIQRQEFEIYSDNENDAAGEN